MERIADQITERYHYYVYDQMEPQVRGWFLMDSPLPLLLITSSYLMFVKWIGPWWMKDRPPFNVDKPMLVYNIVQVVVNIRFFYMALTVVWLPGRYNVICTELIGDANDIVILENTHLFLLSRILDLLDTVFMVLKKNNHQVSFLHVYHHLLVATLGWFILKYKAAANVTFFGTLNAIVHVVMYSYYFITAYNPSYKTSIWWKKQITQLQLIQFVLAIIQQLLSVLSDSCSYPKYLIVFLISQALLMIYLFGQFYKNAYANKKK